MAGTSFGEVYEIEIFKPDLRLHCPQPQCDGPRTFRSDAPRLTFRTAVEREKIEGSANLFFVNFFCGDCQKQPKTFALSITLFPIGEQPPFGIPVPSKVLRLFGEDKANFIKGRQCENQGLGIGAFAYYRRVVENHKSEIFNEIIKVCETVGASEELIEELGSAKQERSFTRAIEQIKTALPHGLLISGHNPLLALHNALSIGLHNESDAKCLEAAHDVRLVLTDLIERMSLLRRDKSELDVAVQRLIAKRGGA